MPYETYDCLIFDLDGTLTDPAVGIIRCMNYALSSMNFTPRFDKEITRFIGPPLEIALRELSGSNDEACIQQLMVTYRERYGELGYAENQVYDGIYNMLDAFHARGIPMGVCTSKLEKYAIKILKEFDLFDYFGFVSGGDYRITKSHQLATLLKAGTINSNALMIGDRAIDLTSAQENGLPGAGVLWGYGSSDELATGQPVFVAAKPAELVTRILG